MKIVILGATGNTGKPLLRQTLEKGHTVTAILRDPSKLAIENSNLKTIKVSCMLLCRVCAGRTLPKNLHINSYFPIQGAKLSE